jgi:hypothetical protein
VPRGRRGRPPCFAIDAFTLSWTHSIEKIRWEEDWRIEGKTLVLKEARIRGSGAGMEPPAGSVLKNGVWHYRPQLPPQTVLRLSHSPHAGGYTLCTETLCAPACGSPAWLVRHRGHRGLSLRRKMTGRQAAAPRLIEHHVIDETLAAGRAPKGGS